MPANENTEKNYLCTKCVNLVSSDLLVIESELRKLLKNYLINYIIDMSCEKTWLYLVK